MHDQGAKSLPAEAGRPRLLDVVRDAIRRRHYSYRTEETYVRWIRRFIVFSGKRHPTQCRNAGEREVGRARARESLKACNERRMDKPTY